MRKAPPRDVFDQLDIEMSYIRGNGADDHVGDHVVLSPEGAVLVESPGTESSNPPKLLFIRDHATLRHSRVLPVPPGSISLRSIFTPKKIGIHPFRAHSWQ